MPAPLPTDGLVTISLDLPVEEQVRQLIEAARLVAQRAHINALKGLDTLRVQTGAPVVGDFDEGQTIIAKVGAEWRIYTRTSDGLYYVALTAA